MARHCTEDIMYMVELRGKLSQRIEGQEDILTSNVFSFFKYANRQVFLKGFLSKLLGIQVSDEEAENAEFSFWTRYDDRTEPDLVITVGDHYLLVEAKFRSKFNVENEEERSQLSREVKGGSLEARNLGKKFYIIALTADFSYKPENFQHVEEQLQLHNFKWINWQGICGFLLETVEQESLPSTTWLFCQDLCRLLDKKNLRSFRDFMGVLGGKPKFAYPAEIFFASETATFRGGFIGFQATLSYLERMNESPHRVFFQCRPLFADLLQGNKLEQFREHIFFSKEAQWRKARLLNRRN